MLSRREVKLASFIHLHRLSDFEDVRGAVTFLNSNLKSLLEFADLCLDLFVQYNWFGPGVSESFLSDTAIRKCFFAPMYVKLLEVDSISSYSLMVAPGLLYATTIILWSEAHNDQESEHTMILMLKSLKVWQGILDDASSSLKEKLILVLESLENQLPTLSISLQILTYSLLSQLCYTFYMNSLALKFFDLTVGCAAIDLKFCGELGVNTKFQKEAKAQLLVKIQKRADIESGLKTTDISSYPKNKALDDDTLLPETKFDDPSVTDLPDLAIEQQVVICLKLHRHLKHMATDTSTEYERKALVNVLTRMNLKYYPIQYYALFQRCGLEGKHIRYLDRLLMQMEELQKCYELCPDEHHKDAALFALPLLPKWETERQYANILFELGCTATALDIFQKLHMWETAAACYVRLDRRTEGTELIKKCLEENPTPKLWCLLGNLTSDTSCYLKALDMTDGKFALAYKQLGTHYCGERRWDEAVEYFEKSVYINNLQPGVWYTMACCAMSAQNWKRALKACQTYVQLEPDSGEGWSNLGAIFLNLKDKKRAYKSFSEAVKHGYDNWQIWENFLYVSLETDALHDAMRSMRRVLEIRSKSLDIEALQKLTLAVIHKQRTGYDEDNYIRDGFIQLMGFLTSKISTKWQVWECYADVYFICFDKSQHEKAMRMYVKTLRHLLNTPKIDSDFKLFQQAVKKSEKIIACFESFIGDAKVEESLKVELEGSLTNLKNFYKLESLFFENMTVEMEEFLKKMAGLVSDMQNLLQSWEKSIFQFIFFLANCVFLRINVFYIFETDFKISSRFFRLLQTGPYHKSFCVDL